MCTKHDDLPSLYFYSEHSSQRVKRVANNVSSYGRDMVQNVLGFMHSVSLKSHGQVLLSMKLLPYPVNQSWFPSALDKLNETALRRMVPAGCVTGELIARRFFLKQENEEIEN